MSFANEEIELMSVLNKKRCKINMITASKRMEIFTKNQE